MPRQRVRVAPRLLRQTRELPITIHEGTWSPNLSYNRNNTVIYLTRLYLCKRDHGHNTSPPSQDTTNWVLYTQSRQTLSTQTITPFIPLAKPAGTRIFTFTWPTHLITY